MSLKRHTLYLASDHAGFDLKSALIQALKKDTTLSHITLQDLGTHASTPSVDYPDLAQELCKKIVQPNPDLGILICGTGIGMSLSANRHAHIRASVCENPLSARLAKEHNHLNVLCLGARITAPAYALEIAQAFLKATPSIDPRHLQRLAKL